MPPAPLTAFCDGCPLKICSVHGCAEERLRDMGLREGAQVEVIQNSDKLIVRLAGCRIGLRRDVAAEIYATPLEA